MVQPLLHRQGPLPPTPPPGASTPATPLVATRGAPGTGHPAAAMGGAATTPPAAPAPRPRRVAAAVATTAAACAAAIVAVAVIGGAALRAVARVRLSPASAAGWPRGPAAVTSGAAGAADAADAGLPPPWGTRPAVAGGDTRCYLVGPHKEPPDGPPAGPPFGSPAATVGWLWANGSRAYCVAGPVCVLADAAGRSPDAAVTLFSDAVSCHSVDAAGRPVAPARAPPRPAGGVAGVEEDGTEGQNANGTEAGGGGWVDPLSDAAACAHFRARHVWRRYTGRGGRVTTVDGAAGWPPSFVAARSSPPPATAPPPPVRWHDGLTVLMPHYPYAEHNLCHWLRGWGMVTHALHHLAQYVAAEAPAAAAAAAAVRAAAVAAGAALGGDAAGRVDAAAATAAATDGRPFPAAALHFVSPALFASGWNRGVMRSSLAAVAAAGGPAAVRVANAHPARAGGGDCFRRAVLPGDDGALVDAHTYASDAPVVDAAAAAADAHVPAIPREALALREAVYAAVGVPLTVHPADTLRLHPPAAGVRSAAAAAGLPAWPASWDPAVTGAAPRPAAAAWPSSSSVTPHPWATVGALFAAPATSPSGLPPAAAAAARRPPSAGDTLRLALPPRSILFLGRPPGSKRRLDDGSAAAVAAALHETAARRGLTLLTVAPDGFTSLAHQVGVARRAGIVVGLHGANLVNAAWAPAGGALLEIFPNSYPWPGFYEAGGNAGLRYSVVTTSPAVVGGAPCAAAAAAGRRCTIHDVRDRVLTLDAPARRAVRARLERAVDYLDALAAASPDGWMTVRGDGAVYRLPDLSNVGDD